MSIKPYQFSKILSMLKSHLEFFLSCRSTLNEKDVAEYHAKIFSIIFIVQLLEIPERVKMILVSILFLTLLKIDWPQLQRFAQASHYFAFHSFLFSVRSAENQKKKLSDFFFFFQILRLRYILFFVFILEKVFKKVRKEVLLDSFR